MAVMMISTEAQASLDRLDDLGPSAPLEELEPLLDELPPLHPDSRLAAGVVAGRRGQKGTHWAALMTDPQFAAGWWWGRCECRHA